MNNLEVRLQHKTDNNTADKNVLSVKKGDPKHPSVDVCTVTGIIVTYMVVAYYVSEVCVVSVHMLLCML